MVEHTTKRIIESFSKLCEDDVNSEEFIVLDSSLPENTEDLDIDLSDEPITCDINDHDHFVMGSDLSPIMPLYEEMYLHRVTFSEED